MMIQINMATGELISSESESAYTVEPSENDAATEQLQAELRLQPHVFESKDQNSLPADLAVVNATLFITTQQ